MGVAIAVAGLVTSMWPRPVCWPSPAPPTGQCGVALDDQPVGDPGRHARPHVLGVSLVVRSGPRLGDIEAGAVAGATSPRFSVASGGLACLVGVGLVMLAFPALKRYDTDEWLGDPAASPA